MANSFVTNHVAVPVERLFEELILGAESLDKGVAEVLEGYQHEVSLQRFFADGSIELRQPKFGAGTLGDFVKDYKSILMEEMQLEFEINPHDFNIDFEFLWTQGPNPLQNPPAVLVDAIMSTVGKRFNNELENLLWNGGLGTITGWAADIAAVDARGNAVTVAPQGAITPANVIGILEDCVAAAPEAVRENANPMIVTTHQVRYAYEEAARALDYKGTNITDAIESRFGGYRVVSTHGVPDNTIYMLIGGPGADAELKAAVWASSDRFNIEMGKGHDLDDTWGVKIAFAMGTGSVLNKQIVQYLPA